VGNFSGQMRVSIVILLTTFISGQVEAQENADSLRHEIQQFFFDLPTNTSLDSLGYILADNKNFKIVNSKTYDPKTTISGQVIKDKMLNSSADWNQFIVSIRGNRRLTTDTLRFGWYITYGLKELELASKNRDNVKEKFKSFFPDIKEESKEGYHGETIEQTFMRTGNMELEIRLTKYDRPGNHRVSIIYTEIRE